MPVSPNPKDPNANTNGVVDRKASSPKRENDVTKAKYPIITKTAYDAIVRGGGPSENLTVKRLCQSRNALGKALLLIAGAVSDHNPQVKSQPSGMYNLLRQIHRETERSYNKFPLEIKNK